MAKKTFTIELPEDFTVELTIGKRMEGDSKTFQQEVKDLPVVSVARLLQYGYQRWINDKVGGKDKTLEFKCEKAEELRQMLRDGKTPAKGSGGGGRKSDPVMVEANAIARAAIKETPHLKAASDKADAKGRAALVKALLEANPRILEEAKETVAKREAEIAKLDLKLDGIDLNALIKSESDDDGGE